MDTKGHKFKPMPTFSNLTGAFPLFPQSETNFIEKITGAKFRFIKNEQGQVIGLAPHCSSATMVWFPDWEATKVK